MPAELIIQEYATETTRLSRLPHPNYLNLQFHRLLRLKLKLRLNVHTIQSWPFQQDTLVVRNGDPLQI